MKFAFPIFILSLIFNATSAEEFNSRGEASQSAKSDDAIFVDPVSGKIGAVYIRESIDKIKKSIRSKRVKKSFEYLEGDRTEVYKIDIDGHEILKYWNATSFVDPVV